MKARTEELLYLLLWSCEKLTRPTFRNLNESFEGWVYRNGFHRQLAELEKQELLESQPTADPNIARTRRVLRLTLSGRLTALGGRDPEACWQRPWDGLWRFALYDVPRTQNVARDRFRKHLCRRRFGYLQGSVWISPDPLKDEDSVFVESKPDVESLILLEGRPYAGETNEEIVAGAWDFDKINRRYLRHIKILGDRPAGPLRSAREARLLRKWAADERAAWHDAVIGDPLLPMALLPKDYLGIKAWQARIKTLHHAANQLRSYRI